MIDAPNPRFYMPVDVRLGQGSFDQLGEMASALGSKPLLVTGKNSARTNGALDRALAQLPNAGVFDDVTENPNTEQCDRLATQCREGGHDVLIAIGGGSPIDAAKAAAGLALNEGPCTQYFGADQFANGVLPIIAVPTTAGAGSEVTPYSVIIDVDRNEKRTISGNALFPKVALLDPELTTTLPRSVTVNTGLDALSQCMEGMVSKKASVTGDVIAIDAIARIRKWLPIAAQSPDNIEARGEMLFAAMISGIIVAQSGTTLVHGMGYAYTVECGVAHGLANALLLTPIFEHNAQFAPDTVARIATAMGQSGNGDPATRIGTALHELFAELGVDPAASAHGVDGNRLPGFAQAVAANPYRFRNQIGALDEEAVTRIYTRSYEGTRG